MKNILLGILIFGIISGIIPIMVASFLSKHIILMVGLIIAILVWIKNELCN